MPEQVMGSYSPRWEDHADTCASLCTNWDTDTDNAFDLDELELLGDMEGEFNGCREQHSCWCPDGSLTYVQWQRKHPELVSLDV